MPGWGSAWKKPILEDLLHHELGAEPRELLQIVIPLSKPVQRGCPDPVHVFHGEDPRGAGLPVNLGDIDAGVVLELVREALHVGRLRSVVELSSNHAAEFVHHSGGVVEVPSGEVFLHQGGQVIQDLEVHLDDTADPGTLDLDHHFIPFHQARPVDLPDGCGRQRNGIDVLENGCRRGFQFHFQDLFRILKREGGHVILQLRELPDEVGGHDVGPGAEGLSELDECGSQLLEREPQPLRAGEGGPPSPWGRP